jgi:arsenate reductase
MTSVAPSEPWRVLFLCTGNSCRSQMAEGLVNHFLGESWQAHSAGTEPAGYVHPLAISAMAELGVDISRQTSKSVELLREADPDLVITVCDRAAESCPVWLKRGKVVHLGFPDPVEASGTEEERLAVFRGVRDAIRSHVLSLLGDLSCEGTGHQGH